MGDEFERSNAYVVPPFKSPVNAASPHIFSAKDESYTVKPDVPLGSKRAVKIIHIGGGFGGLNMAYQVKRWTTDVEIVCYEKNKQIGGTVRFASELVTRFSLLVKWHENKYPGCTCDIPSHSYQFTWALKTDWTNYSPSDEIEEYGQWVAKTHGLYNYFRLEHEVVSCVWAEAESKWLVKVRGPDGKEFIDKADLLINGSGILNNWKWPDIAGRESFKGTMIHSARWDPNVSFDGKRVGIVGVGATAVQIIPNLQPHAKSLKVFMRSKTWITPGFAARYAGPDGSNFEYTEEQKKQFKSDPDLHHKYRKDLEYEISTRFKFAILNSPDQKAAFEMSKNIMIEKLAKKPHLIDQIVPDFAVGCRRPTPGLGFLEALCEDNTDLVNSKIVRMTEKGILTADGVEHELDIIVCATGFQTSFVPRFPIIGRDDIDMRDQWADIAEAYFGLAVANFPNYFVTIGPSSPVAQGTLLPILELLARYYLKFVQKLQIEPTLRSFEIKPELIKDFQIHRMRQLELTAWSSHCSSWFKQGIPGGPNTAIHPGSRLHFFSALENPRFEDYDWRYDGNRFAYLGNGFALRETTGRDMGYYLDDYREEKPFLFEY